LSSSLSSLLELVKAAFKSTGGSSPGGAGSVSGSVKLFADAEAAGGSVIGTFGSSRFFSSSFLSSDFFRSDSLSLSRSLSLLDSPRSPPERPLSPPPRPPPRPRLPDLRLLSRSPCFRSPLDRDLDELELELELLDEPLDDDELLLDEPLELLEDSRLLRSRSLERRSRSRRRSLSIFRLSGDGDRLELELRRPGISIDIRLAFTWAKI